ELCDPQGQIHWRGEQGLWQDFHQWRLSGTPKKYLEQAANEPLHCDLRYQGQIYDRETGGSTTTGTDTTIRRFANT
ncbi:hypothetical protein, partial [Shewanella algae]